MWYRGPMRWLLLSLVSCSAADHSVAAQGKAEISYLDSANIASAPSDPIATGATQPVQVRLLGDARYQALSFAMDKDAITVSGVGRGANVGVYTALLTASADGKATLTMSDGGGKALDSFTFEAATIKTFDVPATFDLDAGATKALEVVPKDASGRRLRAPNAVAWSTDAAAIARFYDVAQNASTDSATGPVVHLRGISPGKTVLHGVYKATKIDVNVTVH